MALETYTPTGMVHNTSVDFAARTITQPIHIVQGDQSLPVIAVEMLLDGQPYAVPAGESVNIRLNKLDGTFVYNPALGCNADRTVAYIEITPQMTTNAGTFSPEIEVMANGGLAGSSKIKMIVDETAIQDGMIESSTEAKALVAYADAAKVSAEAAKTSEESAKASQEAAETAAENAQTSAEAAEASNTAAKESETNAAASATAAADSATASKASEDAAAATLVDVTTAKNAAANSATEAADSETLARSYARGDTATRDGEESDNAKYYMEQAQKAALGTLDTEMSYTSTNAVENRAITEYVNGRGNALSYDEETSKLKLLSGDNTLSEVTIESGSASLQLVVTFDEEFKGAAYTITGGGESYSGTVPDSLQVIQKVKGYNTTYTVKSTANSQEYTSTVATGQYAGEYATTLNTFTATINVSVTVGTAADTGATVEASNGTQTFTQTASAGKAAVTVGKAGTYTITVKKEGYPSVTSPETVSVTTDGSSLTGPSIDIFKATLTVKNDISAATVSGDNTVTVTDGTHSYSKTATGADLTFDILYAGTYTVTMSNGTDTATSSVDCKTSGGTPSVSMAYFSATIKVTTSEGASVQLYKGEATYDSAKTATDGTATFTVHEAGDYHAVASLDGETATSKTITIADGDSKTLDCAFSKIYGVRWNYGASSTALTRLTTSNDSVVTGSVSTEPTAAVGTGAGSSPFDDVYPWSDMEEYNVINNAVSYKRGESGFSRTSYDTVVKIPEFYYKVVQDTSAKTISYYISQKAADGFTKHPGSGRYVGRYNTGANYVTKSGLAPLVNITRATARTGSANHGSNWWQYDYATWCAVWMLYLVEFADWDSQSKVGRGYVDGNSSTINSGGTDSMTYFTGRAAGTDGKTAVQYRHIENPWGNVYEWVDGYNANGAAEYICTDPSKFADDTSSNYTSIGNHVATNAYISGLNVPSAAPYAFQPSAASGSETTYIPDYIYQSTGWRVLNVGGSWDYSSAAGLFCFVASHGSSSSHSSLGARLIYVP